MATVASIVWRPSVIRARSPVASPLGRGVGRMQVHVGAGRGDVAEHRTGGATGRRGDQRDRQIRPLDGRYVGSGSTPSASQTSCTLPPGSTSRNCTVPPVGSPGNGSTRSPIASRRNRCGSGSHCCGSRPRRMPTPTLTSSLVRLSPTRGDHGRRILHHERAVAADDLVDLELRRGRQHQVGESGGVGHRQVVHDGEQIVARQALRARWPVPGRSPPGSNPARTAPRRAHLRRR